MPLVYPLTLSASREQEAALDDAAEVFGALRPNGPTDEGFQPCYRSRAGPPVPAACEVPP